MDKSASVACSRSTIQSPPSNFLQQTDHATLDIVKEVILITCIGHSYKILSRLWRAIDGTAIGVQIKDSDHNIYSDQIEQCMDSMLIQ